MNLTEHMVLCILVRGRAAYKYNRHYTLPGSATFNDEFHVFSIEWKQDQIKWFVDGNLFSTANKADFGNANYPFNEEFYFIINLAVVVTGLVIPMLPLHSRNV